MALGPIGVIAISIAIVLLMRGDASFVWCLVCGVWSIMLGMIELAEREFARPLDPALPEPSQGQQPSERHGGAAQGAPSSAPTDTVPLAASGMGPVGSSQVPERSHVERGANEGAVAATLKK